MPVLTPHLVSRKKSKDISRGDLTIAMLDPLISGGLNLFRVLPRAVTNCPSPPQMKLGPFAFGRSGLVVSAICPRPLTGSDLQVLQMLVSAAAVLRLKVVTDGTKPYLDDDRELLEAMHGTSQTRFPLHSKLELSLTTMLDLLGWANNHTYREKLRESLEALSSVELIIKDETNQAQDRYKLMSHKHNTGPSHKYRRTKILLNPRQSQILYSGQADSEEREQYVKIHLKETSLLTNQIQRILHLRLCQWIDPGKERSVSFEKLISYVTPEDDWVKELSDHLAGMGRKQKLHYKLATSQITDALSFFETKLGWKMRNDKSYEGDNALKSTVSIVRTNDAIVELDCGTSTRRLYGTSALIL